MTETISISEDEYRSLCEYIYRRTGMVFTETKRYYVERRVLERMAITQSLTFGDYFTRLRTDHKGEIERFINAFTVNETYFYREDHQLTCLTTNLLAATLTRKHSAKSIRIWSIPCSSGEEPYSIAIWLLEHWPLADQYDIEIIGSDIDTEVLERARAGIYGARALQRLPAAIIQRYFRQGTNNSWQVIDDLRSSVHFTESNLIAASTTRPHGQFDVIFCRNVLIYFSDTSRRVAAENLFENLAPGGFICLGHTESMSRISPLFDTVRFNDAIVYQRPLR